ncbi:hypothetical protein T265_13639 [Opisthorchis viverrini]|uniref:Peptidase A1 domain-containing protein n=1 Tax=Opisthorchis viverrini TaxID=6198 RepID=A0A075AFY7_OPIVI|nr:hypothetical protein T265_13639 [Opisthorchis viverrini]KER28194.1 hypothetical protein T265_13639 [Opisthorchis viverrini]
MHVATVQVGTPPQKFYVVLDTGSPQRWLLSASSNDPNIKSRKRKYKSKTRKPTETTVSVTYMSMKIFGQLVEDKLTIAGYTMDNFKFLEVTEMSPALEKDEKFDGVFGLVLDMTSLVFHPTLLGLMQQWGLIEEYSVSFRFCGKQSTTGATIFERGDAVFGDVPNEYHYGHVVYLATTPSRLPTVSVTLIRFGDLVLCRDCHVLIDTGSYYIIGPKDLIKKIHLQMTFRDVTERGVYVECRHIYTYPELEVILGGTTFRIPAAKLIMEVVRGRDRKCLSGFMQKPTSEHSWILGMPFLHNVLTVFQPMYQRIGFAKVNCDSPPIQSTSVNS